MSDTDTALLIFAKAPIPGQAKTRLIPALGQVGAANLHARLVLRTLENSIAAGIGTVVLWCASTCDHPFFKACRQQFNVQLETQHGNDLGQRMMNALEYSLQHFRQVLLIGTDCPDMDGQTLRNAALALQHTAPIVFIPAKDGGYALIGVRNDKAPAIFDNIDWGTTSVMEQTRNALRTQNLIWYELPSLADIDTPDDLREWQDAPLYINAGLDIMEYLG